MKPVQTELFPGAREEAQEDFEFFATPAWVTQLILPHLPLCDGVILEPAAGQGAILSELLRAGVGSDRLRAVELRSEGAEAVERLGVRCHRGSFLEASDLDVRPGLIITNPPFSLALEFADRAIELAGVHGTVAMLVRLGWLASQGRSAWHREHPADVYVLPRRPSFTGDGNHDRYDYCWWVHRAQRAGQPGTLRIL